LSVRYVSGPPASGKRFFLDVIGGRPTGPGSSLTGTVTYNGKNVHDVRYQRLAAVISSVDIHLPGLTVRETLEFARNCSQALRTHHFSEELKAIMGEALKQGEDPKLETNLSMLGLKRVADRPVGSPMMPSLTESERHRLTTAEMMAGTYAVYIVDQLNAGGGSFLPKPLSALSSSCHHHYLFSTCTLQFAFV
jgi:ABC-type multidrug transport system ATPase subunit